MDEHDSDRTLPRLGRLGAGLMSAFQRPTGSQTSIREAVADVHGVERFRWILRNTLGFGLALHVLFLGVFLLLNLWWLAAVVVAGLGTDLLALLLLRRGSIDVPFRLGSVEVVVHAAVTTLALGAASGFFVYLPLVTMLTLWHPLNSRRTKIVWATIQTLVFLGLVATGETAPPLLPLAGGALRGLAVMNVFLFAAALAYLAHVSNEATRAAERDLRAALARVDEMARTDTLTGLLNRRAMSELLEAEATRVARHGRPFAVLVADVDDFKAINDAYGHPVGDHVLRSLANRLLSAVRAQDQVARWGGEEFLMLLPETDLDTGLQVAERLREALAAPAVTVDALTIRATATFGVAAFERGSSVFDVIRSADRALYAGKGGGKDRVVRGEG